MSHITIATHDYDSGSGERLSSRTVVDTEQTEADYHVRIGLVPQWPPCRCPIHLDPETGEGTELNLSGLHLVRHPDA